MDDQSAGTDWDRAVQEPDWTLSFDHYDSADEGRREALLALGNGLFVTRAAALDAVQDRTHYPGTYRAGCYNGIETEIDSEFDKTESLVNLPNWLFLNFRIDHAPWFRLDSVKILRYSHGLDLYSGTTWRECLVSVAPGRDILLRERRLISMAKPHIGALRFEFIPQNWSGDVEFCSALDGNVVNANVERYADYEHQYLSPIECRALTPNEAILRVRTRPSKIEIIQAMRTAISENEAQIDTLARDKRWIAHRIRVHAASGKTIAIDKTVTLFTSRDPDVSDLQEAAKQELRLAGDFSTLCISHARAWSGLWKQVAIDVENPRIAKPLRLHAFHLLQTVSPHSAALDVGIPARGWHGEVYHGHIFWDELFVLPFLNARFPDLARAALAYRYRRLDVARAAALRAGYRGAMYPWRSADLGLEVTPRLQKNLISGAWTRDHTHLQRHVGTAIAINIWQYYLATGDAAFLADFGAEMMLEIARFWGSIAEPKGDRYQIRKVIGPDEYHNFHPRSQEPGLDNNAYTNIMAVWTLSRVPELLALLPEPRRSELRKTLALDDEELAHWARISRTMFIPFHGDGIISQFEGFERLKEFNPEGLPPELVDQRTDWALRAIGESPDDYQVTKQADALTVFYVLPEDEVIALLGQLGYRFDRDALLRTARYYLQRTMHRSSLSRVVYAGALAHVDPQLSWKLYTDALETDLNPLKGESTEEGIHLGAMGGTLDVLQRRYLGISACIDGLHLDPALPEELGTICLGFLYQGQRLEVTSSESELAVRAESSNFADVAVIHRGERRLLRPGGEMVIAQPHAE